MRATGGGKILTKNLFYYISSLLHVNFFSFYTPRQQCAFFFFLFLPLPFLFEFTRDPAGWMGGKKAWFFVCAPVDRPR